MNFLLAQLCSCIDGRQWLLEHANSIAVVANRLLRVSPATDDRILCLLESIARFSATPTVVMEIFEVGGVSKMCMVFKADCAIYFEDSSRHNLSAHRDLIIPVHGSNFSHAQQDFSSFLHGDLTHTPSSPPGSQYPCGSNCCNNHHDMVQPLNPRVSANSVLIPSSQVQGTPKFPVMAAHYPDSQEDVYHAHNTYNNLKIDSSLIQERQEPLNMGEMT
ncbi:hypothetical protein DH2020_045711 [Rehmannia glutinosa]|uniref:U-box domain-containing protein n=1 Tax=Rehmannia glutinosa TaxID=99300 RepID=A0ABR0UDE1_REHGL